MLLGELADLPTPVRVVDSQATVGGGSLPDEVLPSIALEIGGAGLSPDRLIAALRTGEPAVIGRIAGDAVLLDLRTVAPDQRAILGAALRAAVGTVAVVAAPGPGAPRP
jgi:L-seryl-tRNA(Ser) seleniumtransferase